MKAEMLAWTPKRMTGRRHSLFLPKLAEHPYVFNIATLQPLGGLFVGAIFIAALIAPLSARATESLWSDTANEVALGADTPAVSTYRSLQADPIALRNFLESRASSGESLSLPLPQGGFSEFALEDSGAMADALAAKFPEIRSFRGDDGHGVHVRVDISSLGFQAMVYDPNGEWVVQPAEFGEGAHYLSFRRSSLHVSRNDFSCETSTEATPQAPRMGELHRRAPTTESGAQRRNYRLALAANGEYTAQFGGTVAGALAAEVIAVNRINEIYETDLNVHMTLVPNNNLIIYTNPATDPYGNSNAQTMQTQNKANLDSVIGSANYDIGHLLSTGAGGAARIASVCTSNTAFGVTGTANPVGDAFNVDYVAHEMGHQFGAYHTFNSTLTNCSGNNRTANSAYEPGSGSTVMGYPGICAADNLQAHADAYFHAKSIDDINSYITTPGGGDCSTNTTNPNTPPAIFGISPNASIPARTPFALVGIATAGGGSSLSYAWEEYDLGLAATVAAGDNGSSPIFRSFNPLPTGVRVFPTLQNLLAGTPSFGETLPTTSRTLHFRLSVRDNRPGNSWVTTTGTSPAPGDVALTVVSTAGPFLVTAPSTAVTWTAGESRTVTWNVAGTSLAPISCANIALDMSSDGGNTFTRVLGVVPNNGSASIAVPAIDTTHARIRASCPGNVFFNVSAPDFSVTVGSDRIFASGFEPSNSLL